MEIIKIGKTIKYFGNQKTIEVPVVDDNGLDTGVTQIVYDEVIDEKSI